MRCGCQEAGLVKTQVRDFGGTEGNRGGPGREALRRLTQRQAVCRRGVGGGWFLDAVVVASAPAANPLAAGGVGALPVAGGCAAVSGRGCLSRNLARVVEPMAPDADGVAGLHCGQRRHGAVVCGRALGVSPAAVGGGGAHPGAGVRLFQGPLREHLAGDAAARVL